MTCAQLWTKTPTSVSRQICCVKSVFQILYAVEQFSSLFSKDKLKHGAHIHQAHDPTFPANSSHMCYVEALEGLASGFPRSLTDGYAMLMSPSKGETAVHSCHCPHDMAVRVREVMAVGWCMSAPCFDLVIIRSHRP